ncbi:TPA: hypothetical protein EYP83_03715 [Candidatus Geothermarchaeota archaeon]|nr:hypothetical protein [Candidatus Geothermarchaeota archaeon]
MDPRFFDLEIYSIYKAVNELLKERTWDVVWRAGEILLENILDDLSLEETSDPYTALNRLADWLRKVGYIKDIEVRRIGEDSIEYVMSNPIITPGAKKLIGEGLVPPHISTALMFALLKKYGYKAEMIGDPIFLDDGRVVERWRLFQI